MSRTVKTLIAEDSELQAEALESALMDLGIEEVTKAFDGVQALKLFKEALEAGNPYSLVFLDIIMPEMNGQEALKQIRILEHDTVMSKQALTVFSVAQINIYVR
jgi:two-component system chemotaxis response regulator CheY